MVLAGKRLISWRQVCPHISLSSTNSTSPTGVKPMLCNLIFNVGGSSFENMLESYIQVYFIKYEGYSKINARLVGKNKRVVIASKRTLSSNKELLFLLYAYPHTFSQKDKARPRFVLLREENESQHVPPSWRERR